MTTPYSPELTQLAVNTIRMLAVDGVEKANSGHPGLPMGAANYAFTLWARYRRFNPQTTCQTATVSFFQPTMVQCCFMHCCTFQAMTCHSRN